MHSEKTVEHKYFLSCDWGTTSFRLYLADARSGSLLTGYSDSDGIRTLSERWSGITAPDRSNRFQFLLNEKIATLAKRFSGDLTHVPVIISGMASSSIGWKDLPYSHLPLLLDQPDLIADVSEWQHSFRHKVILVSGVCSGDDVMRGEETQLIGVRKQFGRKNCICIIPGTHSKHLIIENGALVDFRTYMTGELFGLISAGSILRDSIASTLPDGTSRQKGDTHRTEHFMKGIWEALNGNLLHSLFTIRAGTLLHRSDPEANYDFLSGLLIGTELKDLRDLGDLKKPAADHEKFTGLEKSVTIVGDDHLNACYSAALDYLNIYHTTAEDSSRLTVNGHFIILKQLGIL